MGIDKRPPERPCGTEPGEPAGIVLEQLGACCDDLARRGWAERNAGNVSIRLTHAQADAFTGCVRETAAPAGEAAQRVRETAAPAGEVAQCVRDATSGEGGVSDERQTWTALSQPEPSLGGEAFLVTATGRYLRNVSRHPEENAGVIRLNSDGTAWRPIWGFAAGAGPTSETPAHLAAHRACLAAGRTGDRTILHTHPDNLIALSYVRALDTCSLSRLLWQMHAECIVVFPEGVGWLPWMMAGSPQIAEATAAQLRERRLVLWQWHGVFACGATPDEALGLAETADKAAGILLRVMATGGAECLPSDAVLASIADNFGQTPSAGVLAPGSLGSHGLHV